MSDASRPKYLGTVTVHWQTMKTVDHTRYRFQRSCAENCTIIITWVCVCTNSTMVSLVARHYQYKLSFSLMNHLYSYRSAYNRHVQFLVSLFVRDVVMCLQVELVVKNFKPKPHYEHDLQLPTVQ